MPKFKAEMKKSLTRDEVSRLLMDIAKAMANGRDFKLARDGSMIELDIPDDVNFELEIEENENIIELEIEIKWPSNKTAPEPNLKNIRQETPLGKKAV